MPEKLPGEEEHVRRYLEGYEKPKTVFRINREKTALIVIDLQNEIVEPGGPFWVPETTRQIPKIKKLIETCRALKIPVIYLMYVHHPTLDDKGIMGKLFPDIVRFNEDRRGAEIYSEIAPKEGDKVIRKRRYDGFYGTELDMVLRSLAVDTTIICGSVTNICCLSTAFSAVNRDYKVVFGDDVNATIGPEIQEAVLKTIRRTIGRVLSSEEIIRILKEGEDPLQKES